MSSANRRDAERFAVSEESVGRLRVVHDVEIERLGSEEATVVASTPIPRGEHMSLEIAKAVEPMPSSLTVRALERRAVIRGGRLRQRVWLDVVRSVAGNERGALGGVPVHCAPETPVIGALVRHVPVRLLDISASGCLCESPAIVGEGTVGILELVIHGNRRTEAVRICRSVRQRERLWSCQTGSQFLAFEPLSSVSLRAVVTTLEHARHVSLVDDESGHLSPAENAG